MLTTCSQVTCSQAAGFEYLGNSEFNTSVSGTQSSIEGPVNVVFDEYIQWYNEHYGASSTMPVKLTGQPHAGRSPGLNLPCLYVSIS